MVVTEAIFSRVIPALLLTFRLRGSFFSTICGISFLNTRSYSLYAREVVHDARFYYSPAPFIASSNFEHACLRNSGPRSHLPIDPGTPGPRDPHPLLVVCPVVKWPSGQFWNATRYTDGAWGLRNRLCRNFITFVCTFHNNLTISIIVQGQCHVCHKRVVSSSCP